MRPSLVVMGVCGCGKSTVAQGLAERLALPAFDGDDFHAPEAVARMRAGIALTDDDRWPWLDRLGRVLAETRPGAVVSCSALRRAYRDRLRRACPGVRFVFLDGPAELIERRMAQRQGHYMPTSLLASQLATLERPADDEADVITVDIAAAPAAVIAQACAALGAQELP